MKMILRTLPKGQAHACAYPTCGDWRVRDDQVMEVTVSELGNEDSEFAILVHELIEAWLCTKAGITERQVSDFDREFERERERGQHTETDEPGFDERAPYRKEHQAATLVEMLVVTLLGESWPEHERRIL